MVRNYLKKHLSKNDDAISPVIGTILMVAATVIIAGAVYAAVNAYSGRSAQSTPDAVYKAQAIDTNNNGLEDTVKITMLSGPDADDDALAATVAHAGGTFTVTAGIEPATWSAGSFQTFTSSATSANGSQSYYVTVTMGGSTLLDQTLVLRE